MKRTDHLTDINTDIKDLEDKVSDLEWEGKASVAQSLRGVVNEYRNLREQGVLYIPEF